MGWGGAICTERVESRDGAKHPKMMLTMMAPTRKVYLAPNVSNAKVEKPSTGYLEPCLELTAKSRANVRAQGPDANRSSVRGKY